MNVLKSWNRSTVLAVIAALTLLPLAPAQTAPTATTDPKALKLEKYVVTGSMIKRIADEGALPMETITRLEIEQQGLASAEQLIMALNVNGNGLDNLASNADVVSGAQRGNNGATSANLRGQGSNATLILLNGRRTAAYGLNGGTVDLNSIPFAAIERIEILKATTALYGTDAIGGVMNFILRDNVTGLTANAATDVAQDGGGQINRYALTGGWGNLTQDKFNLMASLAITDNKVLRGDQRDFVNTFQPDRGISPDTRGTPIATVFAVSTLYSALSRDNINNTGRSTGPVDPANPALRVNGINIVDLPTNTAGYTGLDGMGPYDELLWNSPAAKYGSAWDTGRAAVLQQPVRNTNFVLRGTKLWGEHKLIAEAVIGRSVSTKSFSPNQWSTSIGATTPINGVVLPNPLFNMAYPSTGADYNRVFNSLVAYFPDLAVNRGLPLAFRWRSLPLGNRELFTQSDTKRFLVGAEGPLPFFSDWEYRVGVSRATSEANSVLEKGYVYSVGFVDLINKGIVNPFSYTQTPEALTAIDKVRADGVRLYGGTFTTDNIDATSTGPLFKLPAGQVLAAVGLDLRTEKYDFQGDPRPDAATSAGLIFNAPFDNSLATAGALKRDVKAAFLELDIPILKGLDLNAAVRTDDYTGFGRSTNPMVTLRYAPIKKLLLRGSYTTGFRVPTFKQMFDPITESIYAGADLIDPVTGLPIPPNSMNRLFGGKIDLNPEEAKTYSVGFVVSPNKHLSANVDWWEINRTGTIRSLDTAVILANYQLFPDRILRNSANQIIAVDNRWSNAGETITKGIDLGARANMDGFGGNWELGFDMTYLDEKKSRLVESAPFGPSEVGKFTRSSDLGLRYKYNIYLNYRKGNWSARLSDLYRSGYMDAVLPGVANGLVKPANWNPKVAEYDTYYFSLMYTGVKNTRFTFGIRNLFNTEPPFSAAYDTNTGAGSSWEPRVADPRGRSITLSVEYKFK